MVLTEYGKKVQRKAFTESVTKVTIVRKDIEEAVELDSDRVTYPDGIDENPIKAVIVVTGAEVGIGNIVQTIKLSDDTDVLYERTFAQENVCVTDQDTFTFTLLIGN